MSSKTLITLVLFAISAGFASAKDVFSEQIQPLLKEHCVRCHGEDGKVKGKVDLLEVSDLSTLKADPDLIAEVLDAIEYEEMPPEDEPQPTVSQRDALIPILRKLLHEASADPDAIPRTPIRRMNRFQYSNAVQDLFDLNVQVFTLPEKMLREHGNYFQPATGKMPDQVKAGSRPLGKSQLIEPRLAGVAAFPQDLRAEHGFDNRGDHLSLSPLLLESFLTLSRSIVASPDFQKETVGLWDQFFALPSDGKSDEPAEQEIRSRLRSFLTRAFRSPVDVPTLDRYTAHTVSLIAEGVDTVEAMKAAASAAIASPRFLYLYDGASGDSGQSISDFELASRLSFFLWGSIPDQELLDLAAQSRLSEKEILASQFERMIRDRKLKRFCDSFPGQWLQLDRIITAVPERSHHPEFYFAKYRASMHMMLEPLLLFETVLIENRSVIELVDPDFSYRSDLLKSWYRSGRKGKKTPPVVIPFDRVSLDDRREGGVITNAAVMTMTSNATRTQPITRGAWLTTVIFNDPPEPPPADVPPLPEEPEEGQEDLTLRERLDAHREHESCKGCHAKIDPFGFALENYGPTGLWRDKYENGRDVDASGVLFRQHRFDNPVAFKDAILKEKERFVRALTEHLLSFALGREVAPADAAAVEKIVSSAASDNFAFHTILREIVASQPFLSKSNPLSSSE
ncbi:MAG: DUF1592 domain-containing protein [Verrucomicrobiales bacterium]|nr:DUF1592 domain-containing protein [Verrucomicrobiales bacterium]